MCLGASGDSRHKVSTADRATVFAFTLHPARTSDDAINIIANIVSTGAAAMFMSSILASLTRTVPVTRFWTAIVIAGHEKST